MIKQIATKVIKMLVAAFLIMLLALMVKATFYFKQHRCMVYEGELIPLDDFYRKVTGFDSIQVFENHMDFNDQSKVTSLDVNFCFPNQWEREKFRKDTVFIHDTIYKSKDARLEFWGDDSASSDEFYISLIPYSYLI